MTRSHDMDASITDATIDFSAEPHRLLSHQALVSGVTPRPDGAAKLGGQGGYLTDRREGQQWIGLILGSPWPHARIVSIDTSRARALPDACVVTADDIPGVREYGLRHVDRPVFCADKVRCIGDPVAAVAAPTLERAREVLAAIDVQWEPMPIVDDAEAALTSSSALVHESGNLLHRIEYRHGDSKAARAACAHVVDAVYESPRQMHVTMETEGGVAEPDGQGGIRLFFGCQNPERDRQFVASMLALPPARVSSIGTPVGGSYGAKDELTVQPIAALLAWHSGQPVRLHLTRPQSTDLGVKRHPMRVRMQTGCDAEGRLRWHQVDILADTGAYATHGPEVLDAAQEHAVGPYRYDAVAIDGRLAYTNNGIAGAFRGFGAVQTQFALEQQIDQLARRVGIDPVSFRQRNLLPPDGPGPLGQKIAPFDGVHRALDVIATQAPWTEPRQRGTGRYRHGVGLALIHRSDGFGKGGPNGGRIALALAGDGAIELRTSFTEMGQNLIDSIRTLAANALGCPPPLIRPVLGDSRLAPDSGPAAASRSTTLIHQALARDARRWLGRLEALAAKLLGCPATSLSWQDGQWLAPDGKRCTTAVLADAFADALPIDEIECHADETPSDVPGAHYVFGACAAVAKVRIDTWTGALRVESLSIASALGPVVSPLGYLGQMEGGALMGQGLCTTETLNTSEGRYLARNLDGYLIPTLADAPRFEVTAIENLPAKDAIGPRGAGEISVNIAAPAICNAVCDALDGIGPITRLPIAADQLLDWIEANEK